MIPMRHIGLFEGIGGFSLAARWIGWETVAWCEWNPFCQAALKYHIPEAQGFGDITKSDFSGYANAIDVLTGGFPCQGFSLAGKRLGTDDERYLWPAMLKAVEVIRPPWVVGENVTGILSMEDKSGVWREVFPKVESRKIIRYDSVDHYEAIYTRQAKMLVASICEDLEKIGYEVQPIVIPAASVGAPHRRDRVWFVAYRADAGTESVRFGGKNAVYGSKTTSNTYCNGYQYGRFGKNKSASSESEDEQDQREWIWGISGRVGKQEPIANPKSKRSAGLRVGAKTTHSEHGSNGEHGNVANPCRSGWQQWNTSTLANKTGHGTGLDTLQPGDWSNFPTQPPLCSRNDGISSRLVGITVSKHRTESIKAYGNAIVPQVAYQLFKAIQENEQVFNP